MVSSSLAILLAMSMMLHPSAANLWAHASPIPALAPVIRTTFPFKDKVSYDDILLLMLSADSPPPPPAAAAAVAAAAAAAAAPGAVVVVVVVTRLLNKGVFALVLVLVLGPARLLPRRKCCDAVLVPASRVTAAIQ